MSDHLKFVRAELQPAIASRKGGYRFDVLKDGAKIAQWRPIVVMRGYVLIDLSGRSVRAPRANRFGERNDADDPRSWCDVECTTKDEFFAVVTDVLKYIPSPAQIAQRQADEEAAAERLSAEAAEAARIERIKAHGPALLDALTRLTEGQVCRFDPANACAIALPTEERGGNLDADSVCPVCAARSVIEMATRPARE